MHHREFDKLVLNFEAEILQPIDRKAALEQLSLHQARHRFNSKMLSRYLVRDPRSEPMQQLLLPRLGLA